MDHHNTNMWDTKAILSDFCHKIVILKKYPGNKIVQNSCQELLNEICSRMNLDTEIDIKSII